ncbi:fimbria/pilus outer membrane usher protein [Rahnella contaminans]|uniref:fimbria/pilus outer membrane usher protein n=1 Tax=Rahnella contaminans TaxID=2703882 RepID=UPI003C3099B5
MTRKNCKYFALNALTLISMSGNSNAAGFNSSFLEQVDPDNEITDLSAFSSKSGGQLPGKYLVDIYINKTIVDHREIDFITNPDKTAFSKGDTTGLIPCLSDDDLKAYGLKADAALALAKRGDAPSPSPAPDVAAQGSQCSTLLQTISGARTTFDFESQRLNISIPQMLMSNTARGYVDPSLWDEGIPALLFNYNFTGANGNDNQDSYYLNMRSGVNLGAWRLRNYSTWNDNNGERTFNNVNTYVQRSIVPLKAALTLGDSYSNADVFDSLQFRGAQIASDDDMVPDSLKNFAPVIRGIARTNAQVTVEQNGYTVYQTYVTPGAFEITDLYPSSDGGDLTIKVKEEDGSTQTFIQPYASVPILQREGHTKFSLTAGQYRNGYGSEKPEFGQFTLIRGFSKGVTLYGGMQGTENYAAAALGVGKNLGALGAISVDVTQARTQLPEGISSQGQSYRFLYAKTFAETDTDFRLVGYRYSTSGFYSLDDSVTLNDQDTDYSDFNMRTHKRSRVDGSVNQQLGDDGGSLYLSASIQDYWDSSKEQTLQTGYSNTWNGISYNIAYSDNYMGDEKHDRQVSFSVSIQLDRWLKSAWVNYSVSHDSDGRVQQNTGISGSLLADKNLSYSVSQGYTNQGQGNSGNANLNYQGQYGNSNVGYSYGKDTHRVNYGLQGGVVAHSEGITLSQPLGETVVLVAAPGADNTKVMNNTGVQTDYRGYAIVPYTSPYRRTRVSLDTTSVGDKVEIEESTRDVIPTRGAVVKAKFNARVGYRVMMTLTRPDGKPLPFGATVALLEESAKQDTNAGIVGEQGVTYLSGLPEKGTLVAQWGKGVNQQCKISYQLSAGDIEQTLPVVIAKCQQANNE